uniref:Protein kinase domain-containing protein n=1 Tax=Loa loa TaxID=7209 RepID=A0A1I7VTQ0_LOALO
MESVENLPLYSKMELQQNLNRRVVERLEAYVRDRNALNLIDSLLVLDPSLRLDAEQALDHLFFFTQPHPAADVKDLMSTISTSLFEYTAGRGAHSGRGRGVHHQNRQNIRPSMASQGQYVDMVF